MAGLKLYEINQAFLDFQDLIEGGDLTDEQIDEVLNSINEEFEVKADNIACMIKSYKAESKAIEEESKALIARASRLKKEGDKLEKYLMQSMKIMGINKLETTRNVIQIKKNPPALVYDAKKADTLIELLKSNDATRGYISTVVTTSINKTDLKAYIQAGNEVAGFDVVNGEKLALK